MPTGTCDKRAETQVLLVDRSKYYSCQLSPSSISSLPYVAIALLEMLTVRVFFCLFWLPTPRWRRRYCHQLPSLKVQGVKDRSSDTSDAEILEKLIKQRLETGQHGFVSMLFPRNRNSLMQDDPSSPLLQNLVLSGIYYTENFWGTGDDAQEKEKELMELRQGWFFVSLLFSFFFSYGLSAKNISAGSLDSMIRDYAFEALVSRRTGVVYQLPLPSNLSGVEASVVRLRSRSLWRLGENISAFHIPPGTIAGPYVRRLVLVYENLGNWSSPYYHIPGYSLVAPVIALLAYDASNISFSSSNRDLNLSVTGDAISVGFPNVELPKGFNSTIKCARYDTHGLVQLNNMTGGNRCSTKNTGHFAIVVPSGVPSPPTAERVRKGRKWWVWLVAVGGAAGLLVLSSAVLVILKMVRGKKMEEMEKKTEEDEALGTVWVGSCRMPCATMARTQPVIENGSFP